MGGGYFPIHGTGGMGKEPHELGQPRVSSRAPRSGAAFLAGSAFRRVEEGIIHCIKGADQVVNNSTTLVADTDLFFLLQTREHFTFQAVLNYAAAAAADFKVALRAGVNVAIRAMLFGFNPGGTFTCQYLDESNTGSLRGSGVGTMEMAYIVGWVDTDTSDAYGGGGGPDPGRFEVQWAQDALDASDATMIHASWMQLTRLGGSFA